MAEYVQDNHGIGPRQHGFVKGSSCLTNLVTFYDQVTNLMEVEKSVDIVYMNFNKTFDTVFHSILLEKLVTHSLSVSLARLRTGWMAGPKYLWLLELHPVDVQLPVRLPRAQLKPYLHSLSIIWMRR